MQGVLCGKGPAPADPQGGATLQDGSLEQSLAQLTTLRCIDLLGSENKLQGFKLILGRYKAM